MMRKTAGMEGPGAPGGFGRRTTEGLFAAGLALLWAGALGTAEPPSGKDRPEVVLEPQEWKGQELPILREIDVREELSTGAWTVLLYREGCPGCQERAAELLAESPSPALAFIAVPPCREPPELEGASLHGRLSESSRWVVTTPLVLRLLDGVVCELEGGEGGGPGAPARGGDGVRGRTDPLSCDLGYIEPGSRHRVEFRLENPSSQPLLIEKVVSDCGCVQVEKAPKAVPPGGSAAVVGTFEAPRTPVVYERRIVVIERGAGTRRVELAVRARVGLPLRVEPEVLELAAGSGEVLVLNDGLAAVKVLYATSDTPGVIARVPREVLAPGSALRVPVTVAGSPAEGKREATVTLRTTAGSQRAVTCRVRWRAQATPSAQGGGR